MGAIRLSDVQEEAVRYVSSPTIVTAGAGSGKTRTLTSKIAHLVNRLHYDPARILAITFTNKAASEMKGRLELVTGKSADSFPWVRTFHSACFRILKEHCEPLGYKKPLLIHDESKQKSHLKKVLADLNLDKKYINAAARMISNAKNSGDPQRYIELQGGVPRKRETYRMYNELLERSNSVDFDDILLLARDLLRKFPDVRRAYQELFEYILVDEFQDSNNIQNQIVDLLLKDGRLTVVGDDYQSIYKFRGADPLHFINFPEKFPDARVFKLEENYRSTTQIVAASDALIAHNPNRIEKTCFSRREGTPIEVYRFPDEEAEAGWVANKCSEYIHYHKVPLERIAILYRTKFTSLPFERALRFFKVPYTMVGAQGFFLRREVQDINSYLVCAVNTKDDVSFERVINVPRRGIGPGAIKKILAHGSRGMSLQEAAQKAVEDKIFPKKTAPVLESLLLFLRSLGKEKPEVAIQRVVAEMSYEAYMQSFGETEDDLANRKDNIRAMIFDASRKATIADYLEDASLIREDQDDSDKGRGVRLSTIHAAKGLEYFVVFVVGLEERILPHYRSMGGDGEEEDGEGVEEERRLMYVAMTRATDHLHLSWSLYRRGELSKRSRFVGEIPESYFAR